MLRHDDKRYQDVISLSIGRHTDVEESSICARAVKKQVLLCIDDAEPVLYVRVVCDECGEVSSGRVEPGELDVFAEDGEGDDE